MISSSRAIIVPEKQKKFNGRKWTEMQNITTAHLPQY